MLTDAEEPVVENTVPAMVPAIIRFSLRIHDIGTKNTCA
jgi:hypothetical protein